MTTIRPPEQELYEQIWQIDEYRRSSPGERFIQKFLSTVSPTQGSSIIDLGCGPGRGGLALAVRGFDVTMVDFARNCLDQAVAQTIKNQAYKLQFVQADITKPLTISAEYGYCVDVMEHFQPELVDVALDNCLNAAPRIFFQIATIEDAHGVLIKHRLHLTIQPFEWWERMFLDRGCTIVWSQNMNGGCRFYVTAP